jgi:hypothetical protein
VRSIHIQNRNRKVRDFFSIIIAVSFLIGGAVGCRIQPKPGIQNRKAVSQKKEQVLPNINSQGITMHWQEKNATGGLDPLLDINASSGNMQAASQSGVLSNANGVLYNAGKPRARFTAPLVQADRQHNSVIARNGVVITSIEPPGVTLHADRFQWKMDMNKIIATGHVRIVYQPPGAKHPVAWGGSEKMTIDTALQRLIIP